MFIKFSENGVTPIQELIDVVNALKATNITFDNIYFPAKNDEREYKQTEVFVTNVFGTLYEGTACIEESEISDDLYTWLKSI
jgi:hypothetical protein